MHRQLSTCKNGGESLALRMSDKDIVGIVLL